MPKLKLNYRDISKRVWLVRKTRQKNNVINYTCVIYDRNETELS